MLPFHVSGSWNISVKLMPEKALGTSLNSSQKEVVHGSTYFWCVMVKTRFTRIYLIVAHIQCVRRVLNHSEQDIPENSIVCQFDVFVIHMTFTAKKIKFSHSSLSFWRYWRRQRIACYYISSFLKLQIWQSLQGKLKEKNNTLEQGK